MKTRRGRAASLRRILHEAERGAKLFGDGDEASFGELARAGPLADRAASLEGRSVMLAVSSQFAAALAMVDLDGVASRMVLCPPDLSADHLEQAALAAGADAIVTDGAAAAGLERIAFDPRSRRPAGPADGDRRTQWVMFTSGTSGAPKLVAHDLETLTGAIAPSPAATGPVIWSTFYDIRRYGGLQILLRAFLGGVSMVLSRQGVGPGEILERLASHAITHLSGTPSHWRAALMSGGAEMLSPRVVRLSGEIADQPILDAVAKAWPAAAVGHAYASTEAGVGFEVTDGLEGFPASLFENLQGEVEMRVRESTLRIRSPRAARGYVGRDDDLFDAEGFVDTGDIVERRGERFFFLGRRGGMINVGGLKVSPEEVEAVINRHPWVSMSLARARRNPILGAIVVADVVLGHDARHRGETESRASILEACARSLPAHKRPASLRFVESLEVGQNGKVLRRDA